MKTFTYHKSHSFYDVKLKRPTTFTTQLYSLGIYGIINNNPALQFNYKPNDIVKGEKQLKKLQANGGIRDLVFGAAITIAEVDGFWKQV